MSVSPVLRECPGPELRLWLCRDWGEGEEPLFLDEVAGALSALEEFIRPLAMQLLVITRPEGVSDARTFGPDVGTAAWEITTPEAAQRTRRGEPLMPGHVDTVEPLDGAAVRVWMERALDQPAPGCRVLWENLESVSVCARITPPRTAEVVLEDSGARVPVAAGWVAGPREDPPLGAPARIRFIRDGWTLHLGLRGEWGPQWFASSTAQIQGILLRLAPLGWAEVPE